MGSEFEVIVDTTHYAGNFERELCAWLTGQVGECGVGAEIAEEAAGALRHAGWWRDHVVQMADDHEVFRPVSLAATPGFFNHGMGGAFPDTEDSHVPALAHYRNQVADYYGPLIARTRSCVGTNGWTAEAVERDVARSQAKIDEANALEQVRRYPSYQSVCIAVDAEPPEDVLEEVRDRLRLLLASPEARAALYIHRRAVTEPEFAILGVRVEETIKPMPVTRTRLAL